MWANKLANIISELNHSEIIADAELKAIVSGEASTVENKGKDPFVLRPYATCWFATNHMPHTKDFSDALFRRAIILPFNRQFSISEQDHKLKDILMGELSGILNMALNAYAKAIIEGFAEPESLRHAKHEWRFAADQVAQFVEEKCNKSDDFEVAFPILYAEYNLWWDDQGISNILSKKAFRERLTRLGMGNKRKSQERLVTGIRLA